MENKMNRAVKLNYKAGDIFYIPLGDNEFSICKVLWAPGGDYRKVFSFCVLEHKSDKPIRNTFHNSPVELNDNGKCIKVIFTGVKRIVNGEWGVIANEKLNPSDDDLLYFHISGTLHKGDEHIRILDLSEYQCFRSMSVFGFDLVLTILND